MTSAYLVGEFFESEVTLILCIFTSEVDAQWVVSIDLCG